MKRIIATTTITVITALALATGAFAFNKGGAGAPPDDAVRQLHRQIAAKVLYDGLRLSPEQKTALAAKIAEVRGAHEARGSSRDARRTEIEAALTVARDEVYRTGTITPATREKLQQIHREGRDGGEERRDKEGGPREALAAILTPQQIDYLKDFDPMRELGLAPSEGRGPGAAREGGKGERLGERIKAMPEAEYQEHKQRILERAGERMKDRGVQDADARLQKLGTNLDTLRTGTPEQIAAIKADHDLQPMLGHGGREGRGGQGGPGREAFRGRHGMKDGRKLLLSPEFQALLEGKSPEATK